MTFNAKLISWPPFEKCYKTVCFQEVNWQRFILAPRYRTLRIWAKFGKHHGALITQVRLTAQCSPAGDDSYGLIGLNWSFDRSDRMALLSTRHSI